ncbi:MAG: hydroxymethylglutaryl-CoA reductase, degradative [Candidatus Aenigmarchaeota archaeon]|nr:hydroxymethylglutaryl-CoA reductase, degradative [Candidatus Aenigmarchaeota archaeon]
MKKFYEMSVKERREELAKKCGLTKEELKNLDIGGIDVERADVMIENVIGVYRLPLAVAQNFVIDGKPRLIPMVIEEPSVVAAASNGAKLTLPDGFKTKVDDSIMIGQMQIVKIRNISEAEKNVLKTEEKILEKCNDKNSTIIKLGGGARRITTKQLKTAVGEMLILNFHVDVLDSMGANTVNTMLENISSFVEKLTGGKTRLKIISNLADERLARAEALWKKEVLGGEDVVDKIIEAYEFSKNDIYRCSTHNKGIMNGVDALVIALGNDFRAVEAGAHSYAAFNGYKPLTKYEKTRCGDLKGSIELPMAIGTVGGAIKSNSCAQLALKILGVKTAKEASGICATLGLAQNFAALKALSTEGIQKGHMKLHARNMAIAAGAKGKDIQQITKQMIEDGNITISHAETLLKNRS